MLQLNQYKLSKNWIEPSETKIASALNLQEPDQQTIHSVFLFIIL